jgi:23S rRNA (guanosine2251-2'-O)-methyltransferase
VGGELVDGLPAVRELFAVGSRRVRSLWVADDLDGPTAEEMTGLAVDAGVPVRRLPRSALAAEAGAELSDGVLALAAALHAVDLETLAGSGRPPFLLLVDGIAEGGRLGVLLRSARQAGVTGVVLLRHRATALTAAATRTAAGAIEHLPIATVAGMPNAVSRLRTLELTVVGLDPDVNVRLADNRLVAGPVALVADVENGRLPRATAMRCDSLAGLPDVDTDGRDAVGAVALACLEVGLGRRTP